MGIGARFYKADLHIHTPASHCYQSKTDTAKDIIDSAKKQGLQIIAITDHNQFKAIQDLKSQARDSGVVIFPGLEITTENCHLLALFDPDTSSDVLDDLLTKCGIDKDKDRGYAECTGDSALAVLDQIKKYKGIAIAAHCDTDGKSSLFQVKNDVQNKILDHDCLRALEVHDLASSAKHLVARKHANKKPLLQSSDAHRLDEIGARYTYLKMDTPTLEGLKLALLEPQTRIRHMEGMIDIHFPYIENIGVDIGFLRGNVIEFSPYLTCLIGGTGTGKSTIIECLRYCFDDLSGEKGIQDDTFGKLKKLVGAGGVITVTYRSEYGESIILRREVNDDLKNDASAPTITDAAGNECALLTKPRFYSQGEIALIARRPTLQMSLIDSNLDLSEEESKEKDLLIIINKLSGRIVEANEQIQRHHEAIDDPDTGKIATTKRLRELKKILKDEVFEEFPKWEKEKRVLESTPGVFKELKTAVSRYKEGFNALSANLPTVEKDSPNYTTLKSIIENKIILDTKADSVFNSLLVNINNLEKKFLEIKLRWEGEYETTKTEYLKLLEGIKEQSIKEAQSNYRKLQKRLDQLKESELKMVALEKARKQDFAARAAKVDELLKVRASRFFKRDKLLKSWSAELKRTHVGMKRSGDDSQYLAKLDKALTSSGINKNDKATIINKLRPQELFKLAWTSNHLELGKVCEFSEEKAKKMLDFLRSDLANLFTLDTVDIPDVPDIRFEKSSGIISPLEELSTGEKSIALLSIVMMQGNFPIVIDQPEDSLDTRFIYDEIVSKLKQQKDQRQFICTSHNANIVISADSDLTHVLDATVNQAVIESSGGIEDRKTNELMLAHLEGGETAFRLRTKKYLLPEI